MSDCLEVLFASDSNGKMHTTNCYNPHIGTTLMSYKGGGGAAKNTLSVIGKDYLISADVSQPLLHVWPLNSQESSHELRTVVFGKPTALCVSPDGYYCISGIDGKIYIWQISNGVLLNVIPKHFQAINKIIFTEDSSHFVTAGEDGLVLVWRLADAIAKQFGEVFRTFTDQVEPVFNFSQHSLPVTDVFIGRGNKKARLFSVSADQTCKIFSLTNGTMILSVVFNHVLTSLTVNESETELFVGMNGGQIQNFNLDPYPRSVEHHISEETVTFSGHSKAVTFLCTSLDGVTLASGSDDEKVFLWNIPSRQLIRSFDMKGPVTNLFFYFASSNIFVNKVEPHLVVSKFEKVSRSDDQELEINVLVHEDLKPISLLGKFNAETGRIKPCTTQSSSSKSGKEDVAALKQEILRLKDINKQLYQFAINKIIKTPVTMDIDTEHGVED